MAAPLVLFPVRDNEKEEHAEQLVDDEQQVEHPDDMPETSSEREQIAGAQVPQVHQVEHDEPHLEEKLDAQSDVDGRVIP